MLGTDDNTVCIRTVTYRLWEPWDSAPPLHRLNFLYKKSLMIMIAHMEEIRQNIPLPASVQYTQ